MNEKKKNRKWVLRAIVAFLIIMLLLTFFSNTIMNATIPKVVAEYSQRGTLSHSSSAKGNVEIDNKKEYKVPKELDGRKVAKVEVSNYDSVSKGQTTITLEKVEKNEDLETWKETLDDKIKEREYAARTPKSANSTIDSLKETAELARQGVVSAEADLNLALNKDATLAAAQAVINDNSAAYEAAAANCDTIAQTIESNNAEISDIDTELSKLQDKLLIFETMGIPMPEPTPPGSVPVTPEPGSIEEVVLKMDELNDRRAACAGAVADAQGRQNDANAEKERLKALIDDANATIEAANMIKDPGEAQAALDKARKEYAEAQKAVSDQSVNDQIDREKEADKRKKDDKELEDLKKKIEKAEKNDGILTIESPAAGYIIDLAVSEGDVLTEKTVLFSVMPEEPEASVKFSFSTEQARDLQVGMDLKPENSYYDRCTIVSIKPDEHDPRNTRIVKCKLESEYIYPGDEISVSASKSNAQYDTIVPSSAVQTDNTGKFVYALEESNTPLGSKFTVKKIMVTEEDSDGSRTAIKAAEGDQLDGNLQYVTRSEEPLKDGDRVRLQDYSKKE